MDANPHRRGVIKREQVRVDEHEARTGRAATQERTGACAAQPRVRLLQLDEHTQAIEFTCPCGEVSLIEIQCEKKP